MRDPRGSLPAMAFEKVRREGLLSLLRHAPSWVLDTTLTETRLAALRRLRHVRYRHAGLQAIPDPAATIEIDPAEVTHVVPLSRFPGSSPRELMGTIRGGDWDRNLPRVEDRPKYQACRRRVEDGVPWEETGIIDRLAAELAASDTGSIEHGCSSRAELRARYETERESLYRSLRSEGYDRSVSPVCCRIHVGRDGRLLFGSGGRHRFYLSRLLDIESVPVEVLCRHRQWQDIREEIAAATTLEELPADIRHRLDHPDLQEFTLETRLTPERAVSN